MEWLREFCLKFGEDKDIKTLKEDEFYGHITINFFKGNIVDINIYKTKKPKHEEKKAL